MQESNKNTANIFTGEDATTIDQTASAKPAKKTIAGPDTVDELRSEATMQLLQESVCPSLSGRAQLTSQKGYKEPTELNPSGISLRVYKNSGTGIFNKDWIRYEHIAELLQPLEAPFSWKALQPLYPGLSSNSPGFLLAVLLNEGIVEACDRRYQWKDPADFLTRMKKIEKTPQAQPKGLGKY